MRRHTWTLVSIILITIVTLVINLSQPIPLNVEGTMPFTQQKVSFHQTIPGIDLQKYLGSIGIHRDFAFKKGLDLEGGTSVTLKADMSEIPEAQREDALNSAKSVIEKRVNLFGVSEPLVQTAKVNKDYRIIVEIPGITDVNQAVALVGKTANLTFWEDKGTGMPTATSAAKLASNSAVPVGLANFFSEPAKTELSGADLKSAAVSFSSQNGQPEVVLTFTPTGAKKFAAITRRNVGKVVAIALDNEVINTPVVKEVIVGGNAVINGNFTTEQAKNVQIQLNAGALPLPLSVLEQRAIGATLGQASLEKSMTAGILGFFVIVFFMIALYGRLGVLASVALVIYTLILLTLFRLVPVTLTLAGIAGFILSIGIAVDANILIFERMKEELRRGRTLKMAIDLGFSRAWLSIRDSNVSSLITSAILFYFGTGMIRGFALTLALGIIVSMFSAIIVTRTLLQVFYKEKEAPSLRTK